MEILLLKRDFWFMINFLLESDSAIVGFSINDCPKRISYGTINDSAARMYVRINIPAKKDSIDWEDSQYRAIDASRKKIPA